MSLRNKLNNNAWIVVLAVIVLIIIAGYSAFTSFSTPAHDPGNVYFTDDDGATFFQASLGDISPMQRNGKTAYRAHVFQCADGVPFVGFMERLPQDLADLIRRAKADPNSVSGAEIGRIMAAQVHRQVKRPGANEQWEPMPPMGVVPVNCPDGTPATALR